MTNYEGEYRLKKIVEIPAFDTSRAVQNKIRTAAYCRVSTRGDAQLESLGVQKAHYETYINARPDLHFVGLYYDEGISGTKKETRPEFMRMIADCEKGRINFVITKSISRFSRNTADCLEMVRKLIELQIPIFFEKENINTGTMESELFLSLLSGFAEEESRSISNNNKWAIQKRFQSGTFKHCITPYGYKWDGNKIVIEPSEAEDVKFIFQNILTGTSLETIANVLNEQERLTRNNNQWTRDALRNLIANEKYVGDVLMQKTYTDFNYRRHTNRGEEKQYKITGNHEALISRADFEAANLLIHQRAKEKNIISGSDKHQHRYCFTGKIICANCGSSFKRRTHRYKDTVYYAWCCKTHLTDKDKCSVKFIKEEDVKRSFATMINKLIFGRNEILKPYISALRNNKPEKVSKRLQELRTLLLDTDKRLETISALMSQGYLDRHSYHSESVALISQKESYKSEIERLNDSSECETLYEKETCALLKFTERNVMLNEFDEELFNKIVNKIVVNGRDILAFELNCGLTFEEII